MPARCAAASSSVACGRSSANGFSQITCRPAWIASNESSAWSAGGAAIVTASTPGNASASANVVHACSTPARPARRLVRSASRPTSASTSNPAARSAGTCTRAPKPVPMTATPVGSLMR